MFNMLLPVTDNTVSDNTVTEGSPDRAPATGAVMTAPRARRFEARDIAVIAVFAAITAALGLLPAIYLPISPVPITAQTFGVILAGAVIGGRRAFASQVLFLALVAIGLPILAGGRGGIGVFASPTVGFLVAFPIAAGLIGWATQALGAPYRIVPGLVINTGFGIGLTYLFGWTGMLATTHLGPRAAFVALAPFLIGDAVKVVLATATARGVHASYPGLLSRGRPRGAASDPA